MKKKFITAFLSACILSMSACGSPPAEGDSPAGLADGDSPADSGLADSDTPAEGSNTGSEAPAEGTFAVRSTDTESEAPAGVGVGEVFPTTNYAAVLNVLGDDKNFAYAPESLNAALSMYAACLNDSLEKEEILALTGGRNYLSYRNSDSYKLVNRIWYDVNKEEIYDFSNVPELESLLYGIDMSSPDATQIKNDYVAEQTEGFITSTPTEFTSDTAIDFMDVAYFNAIWDSMYQEFEVMDDEFRFFNIHGDYDEPVEAIGFTDEHGYYETDDAYGCVLYYSSGKEEEPYLMIVILPKEPDYGDVNFIRRPNPVHPSQNIDITPFLPDWNGIISAEQKWVDIFTLKMPRISVECNWTLESGSDIAQALSLPHFGTGNFNTDIYPLPTDNKVSQVIKVESDENGTTAAAVTEVIMMNATAEMPQGEPTRFDFICERPFLYVIYDTINHDVAFIGQVTTVSP